MLEKANVICNAAERAEVVFNIADSTPIVGAAPSLLRTLASLVQIVAGIVFAGYGVANYGLSMFTGDELLEEDAWEFTKFGIEFTGHGIQNTGRSLCEGITLGFGGLIYNVANETGFLPVREYGVYGEGQGRWKIEAKRLFFN